MCSTLKVIWTDSAAGYAAEAAGLACVHLTTLPVCVTTARALSS